MAKGNNSKQKREIRKPKQDKKKKKDTL